MAVEQRTNHGIILWLSIVVVLLSATLRIRPPDTVYLPALEAYPLPQVCWLRNSTGYPCPGCGMTRSFISMAHAQFAAAFRYQPLGPLLFLVAVAQIPYRWWRLRGPAGQGTNAGGWESRSDSPHGDSRVRRFSAGWDCYRNALIWLFVIALLGTWVYRLATMAQRGAG